MIPNCTRHLMITHIWPINSDNDDDILFTKAIDAYLFVPQSYVVGIIVPDEEILMKWAAENGLSQTFDELCQNKVRLCFLNMTRLSTVSAFDVINIPRPGCTKGGIDSAI